MLKNRTERQEITT